jgi:peptide/nickel transport system ATP-binding protein
MSGLSESVRSGSSTELLKIDGLAKHFPPRRGFLGRPGNSVRAVDGVSLTIDQGETLGLVGESGCGKSTLGRCIVRLYEPTAGHMSYRAADGTQVDLAHIRGEPLTRIRREIRMIFQDPRSSLDPRMSVFSIVAEPIRLAGERRSSVVRDRVAELLTQVGLREEHMDRFPHAFSGGERQRIGIARALALNPRLVIADEAVSALDVSVQAQILNLLRDLQEQYGLTYLFVSHDLGVIEHLSTRVAVMYVGRLVELAPTATLFARPRHPYTEALLSAVPIEDPTDTGKRVRIRLPGDVADPSAVPSGCPFHPRCHYARDVCRTERPPLRDTGTGHLAACHFAEDLELEGTHDT